MSHCDTTEAWDRFDGPGMVLLRSWTEISFWQRLDILRQRLACCCNFFLQFRKTEEKLSCPHFCKQRSLQVKITNRGVSISICGKTFQEPAALDNS